MFLTRTCNVLTVGDNWDYPVDSRFVTEKELHLWAQMNMCTHELVLLNLPKKHLHWICVRQEHKKVNSENVYDVYMTHMQSNNKQL